MKIQIRRLKTREVVSELTVTDDRLEAIDRQIALVWSTIDRSNFYVTTASLTKADVTPKMLLDYWFEESHQGAQC